MNTKMVQPGSIMTWINVTNNTWLVPTLCQHNWINSSFKIKLLHTKQICTSSWNFPISSRSTYPATIIFTWDSIVSALVSNNYTFTFFFGVVSVVSPFIVKNMIFTYSPGTTHGGPGNPSKWMKRMFHDVSCFEKSSNLTVELMTKWYYFHDTIFFWHTWNPLLSHYI